MAAKKAKKSKKQMPEVKVTKIAPVDYLTDKTPFNKPSEPSMQGFKSKE